MALFKRDKRETPPASEAVDVDAASTEERAEVTLPEETVPQVGISFSTFGKAATPPSLTRPAPERRAGDAPTAQQMPENRVLRATLAALPEKPENRDIMHVMRQAMQGQLYLRVAGNAQELIAQKKPLTLAVTTIGDQRFLLAYSGASALKDSLQADEASGSSALAQPAHTVLRNTIEGPYAGLLLDHATPGSRIILPAPLIEKTLEEAGDAPVLKNLLVAGRAPAQIAAVAQALTTSKLWVAAGRADADGPVGLAEVRTEDGRRNLQVFSHPLEAIVLGRDDRPVPITPQQLAQTLRDGENIDGLVIDPAGPWMQLTRDDLAPLLALADDAPAETPAPPA